MMAKSTLLVSAVWLLLVLSVQAQDDLQSVLSPDQATNTAAAPATAAADTNGVEAVPLPVPAIDASLPTEAADAAFADEPPPPPPTPSPLADDASAAESSSPPVRGPAPALAYDREGLARDMNLGVAMKRSAGEGVPVIGVIVGSPAARAGIKPGDTLLTIHDQAVTDPQQVADIYHDQAGNEDLVIAVRDKTGLVELVKVSAVPPPALAPDPGVPAPANYYPGAPPTDGYVGAAVPGQPMTRQYVYRAAPGYAGGYLYRGGPAYGVTIGNRRSGVSMSFGSGGYGYGPGYGYGGFGGYGGYGGGYYGRGLGYGGYGPGYGYGRGSGISFGRGGVGIRIGF
jgi:hypothetical protein